MTRKDYVAIAAAIETAYRNAPGGNGQAQIYALASAIADHMAADNARFDRERFMRACGVGHRIDHFALPACVVAQ